MNIALLDLNHMSRGVHTNTVPLGLGLVSRYLKKSISHKIDIKIFKEANKALDTFKSWKPDIVGLAQYVWNSELNLHLANLVKENNPNCLIVAGGPNLELSKKERVSFLNQHQVIDICVAYDGEIPFAEIVKRFLNGQSIDQLRRNPVVGTYSLDLKNNCLIESHQPAPRLSSLDVFGPIYADRGLDEFLDAGFHPFVQTHRGCPFGCAFCHTSDSYYSKMLFQSPEIFRTDMEYLGKRFSGQDNVLLYMANANMSLFKEDFEIAKIIREVQDKYDWPKIISVNSGKDPKKLLDMFSVINFRPAIALQTLTPGVLSNINRKNIPFNEFCDFQKEIAHKTGKLSGTELILTLPGETKESFLETLSRVINSDIQNVVIYTLMNLKGSPLSTQESKNKYGYLIRHRIVPRQFSKINGVKVIDSEEVVVAANSMSYADYLELRGLSFIVKIFFSSAELRPLKKFLRECGIDIAQWVFGIKRRLSEFPDLEAYYQDFIKETEEELFPSLESLRQFFSQDKNWDLLCSGRFGENLLRKYMQKIIYQSYDSFLKLAFSEAYNLVVARGGDDRDICLKSILDDLLVYLSIRDTRQIVEEKRFIKSEHHILKHDIPCWVNSDITNNFLKTKTKKPYKYSVRLTEDSKKWLSNFSELNRDMSLSLQNLYHQGGIENFWPEWVLLER